jgi:hypothetical protein
MRSTTAKFPLGSFAKIPHERGRDQDVGFGPLRGMDFNTPALWMRISALLFGCGCLSPRPWHLEPGIHKPGLGGHCFWDEV